MWQLAIDLGTRCTKAARVLDGVAEPLALAGRLSLPSAVFLHRDGSLRAGWEAWDRGAVAPERLEATPRRWLANGSTLVVGGTVVPVVDALEAIVRCAVAQATEVVGSSPEGLVLTYPGGWPATRTHLLAEAADRLDVPLVGLVPEPVAAVAGSSWGLPIGAVAAVYDLGAGTLGTSVVTQTAEGLRIVGRPGGHERMGGDVFDERVAHVVAQRLAAAEPGVWDELDASDDLRWQRARLSLRIQVRQAREQLSSLTAAQVAIPMTGRSMVLTREELESLVGREVEQAAEALRRSIVEAGLDPSTVQRVLVVGGASRTPIVQWSLLTRFGERVAFAPDPERSVALGAARLLAAHALVPAATSTVAGAPVAPPRPGSWSAPGSTASAPPPGPAPTLGPPAAPPAPPMPPAPPVLPPSSSPTSPPAVHASPGVPPMPDVGTPPPAGYSTPTPLVQVPPLPDPRARPATDRLLLVVVVVLAAALGVAVALLLLGR